MAVSILKIKIMPEQKINLENLKKEIAEKLKKAGAIKIQEVKEEEIAFGLKALIITLAWPEEKDTSVAENAIKSIEGVSSLDIIDYRRAFG